MSRAVDPTPIATTKRCPTCLTPDSRIRPIREYRTSLPDGRTVLVIWGTCEVCDLWRDQQEISGQPLASVHPGGTVKP
jgi:hypothetical protein